MSEKTALGKIVEWNESRGLIKTPQEFDLVTDMSFITEELLEASTGLKSEEAREKAKALAILINDKNHESTPEQMVDAFCDIIVFAVGSVRKLGYNPDIAMAEVQREIDSRVGEIKDGKFVKDKSPEAKANWYTANFDNAKIQ
jgi:NTP pyrophosphatase (non-canonical NTP hydrolase)